MKKKELLSFIGVMFVLLILSVVKYSFSPEYLTFVVKHSDDMNKRFEKLAQIKDQTFRYEIVISDIDYELRSEALKGISSTKLLSHIIKELNRRYEDEDISLAILAAEKISKKKYDSYYHLVALN